MHDPYRPPESFRPEATWSPSLQASDNTANAHRMLAIFYAALTVLVGWIAYSAHSASRGDALGDTAIVMAVVGFPAALHGLIWRGASRRSGWARGASKAVGVLMLLGFPIGTLIGVYLLRNASKPWAAPKPA